jgi:hypothetical protein
MGRSSVVLESLTPRKAAFAALSGDNDRCVVGTLNIDLGAFRRPVTHQPVNEGFPRETDSVANIHRGGERVRRHLLDHGCGGRVV